MSAFTRMVEAIMDCGPVGCCSISEVQAKEIASAALRAIRVPDDAVAYGCWGYFNDPCWWEDVGRGFTAMIDAIEKGQEYIDEVEKERGQ